MINSRSGRLELYQGTLLSATGTIPHTRVILAVDRGGNIVYSRVVPYRGGDIAQYYKRLYRIENEFARKCAEESRPCRIYSGTADNVASFLTLFPEVASPFFPAEIP